VGLGVADEAAEVVAEIHTALRDGHAMPKDRIVDELGDVLWYSARVAELVDITLADAPQPAFSAGYEGWYARAALIDACFGLVTTAGAIAGHIKKALRDNNGRMTDVRQARITDQLGGLLAHGALLAKAVDATLRDAVDANITKVRRRLANGTLAGSGDR
jgi:NTP pyrophosphatase (non-canonical NTP hydrolase)